MTGRQNGDSTYAESECGHTQAPPTPTEIRDCAEVIVRRCPECLRELWWNVDRWRRV